MRSASWYFSTLQSQIQADTQWRHQVDIDVLVLPFESINSCLPHDLQQAAELMRPHLMHLAGDESGCFLLGNITLHQSYDLLVPNLPRALTARMVHLRDVVNQYWPRQHQRACVLGSAHTMRSGYVSGLFSEHSISWQVLDDSDVAELERLRMALYPVPWQNTKVISDQAGISDEAEHSQRVLAKLYLKYPGVERWIVGCTEFAFAAPHAPSGQHFFDLPRLQCRLLAQRATNRDFALI
jgi:aspartate/glutamate racemase